MTLVLRVVTLIFISITYQTKTAFQIKLKNVSFQMCKTFHEGIALNVFSDLNNFMKSNILRMRALCTDEAHQRQFLVTIASSSLGVCLDSYGWTHDDQRNGQHCAIAGFSSRRLPGNTGYVLTPSLPQQVKFSGTDAPISPH